MDWLIWAALIVGAGFWLRTKLPVESAGYEPRRAAPSAPAGRTPKVPKSIMDDDSEDFGDGPPIRLPLSLFIEYVDANGGASARRISVRNLRYSKGRVAINSFCHEREEPRCFISDRVQSAEDCETGEVIRDPADWFLTAYMEHPDGSGFLQKRDADTAAQAERRAYQDALLVLVYVAKADGRMEKPERAVILDAAAAMRSSSPSLSALAEMTEAKLQRMSCDHSEFLRAVRELKASRSRLKAAVIAAADRVMKADGAEDASEQKALAWLRRSLV